MFAILALGLALVAISTVFLISLRSMKKTRKTAKLTEHEIRKAEDTVRNNHFRGMPPPF